MFVKRRISETPFSFFSFTFESKKIFHFGIKNFKKHTRKNKINWFVRTILTFSVDFGGAVDEEALAEAAAACAVFIGLLLASLTEVVVASDAAVAAVVVTSGSLPGEAGLKEVAFKLIISESIVFS